MSKIIKALMYVVVTVIVLIVAAVVIIPLVVDPNDYKPQISSTIKEHTGRDLTIDGALKLSVFPWLGIETGPVSLSNAPGFGEQHFATIEAMQIKAKVVPLLSKRVEVSRIVLKGLNLNLAKNKQGISNWDDLFASEKTKDKPQPEPTDSDAGVGQASRMALAVGGLSIEDAHVIWDDRENKQHIKIEDFNFLTDQLEFDKPVDFELRFTLHNKEPEITEKLKLSGVLTVNNSMDNFSVDGFKLRSETEGESVPGGTLNTDLALSAQVNLIDQIAKVSGLRLNVGDLVVSGDLSGENIIDSPVLKGPIAINEFSPKKLMATLGMSAPETSDADVLQKFKADFNLNATANSVALDGISIQLDETSIKGAANVNNFSNPAVGFNFDIDAIDVDRYLPPKQKADEQSNSKESTSPATQGGSSKQAELPLVALAELNLDGKLKLEQLKVNGIKASGIALDITGKNHILNVKQSIQKLYEGSYQGTTRIDANGSVPQIALTESLSNLKIEPFLLAANGKAPISGTAQFDAQLNGRGVNIDAIKSSLNGTVNALVTDGAIKGVDIVKIIRNAESLLGKNRTPQSADTDQTEFSEIKFASKIINGVVNNHELVAKGPLARANGSGTVNLVNEKIDYQLKANLIRSSKGTEAGKLKGVPIAIDVGGTLSEPSYQLNPVAMLQEKHKAKIEEKKQELLEKLDKKIGPGASDLLQQFF